MIRINYIFILSITFLLIGCRDSNNHTDSKKVESKDTDSEIESSNSKEVESTTIEQFENNTSYFIREIDINGDGVKDKIVSSEKYEGNQLYFFQKEENGYTMVLESINFSEDGGRIIGDVLQSKDDKEGLIIHTYFPDGGNDQATYIVSFIDENWILTKTIYEIGNWKEDHTKVYICEVDQNLILKDLISEKVAKQLKHLPEESERASLCKVKSLDNNISYNRIKETVQVYKKVYVLETESPCGLKITLEEDRYHIKTNTREHAGTFSIEDGYITFKGLLADEPKTEVQGTYDGDEIVIQNYGNAMNSFTVFGECGDQKYLRLVKK